MQAVGPNEHCPCGSGRKYKKCHGRAEGAKTLGWLPVVTGVAILLLAGIAYFSLNKPAAQAPSGSAAGAPSRQGQPWEYDAASNTHFDPTEGHKHWHQGPPPQGQTGR